MTVELVLLAPVLVMFALFAVGLGRYELAREEVVGAARAAAEAASVVGSPGQAQLAANSAADPGLQGLGDTCKGLQVETDTNDFVPGGFVTVTVSCHVSFSYLLIPGLPGAAVVKAVQTAPIDPFRSVQ
ncbi:MAG: TadE/TadG family type IV pilus assembly protein [Nitrososphaerales archaeon]